jgi:3-oxoadipate enol-lactonase
VLDHLGIDRAVIAGLSMGGYVALAFMALFPERVKGLVLCSTRAGADNEKAREGREATAHKAIDKGAAAIADELLPKMLSPSASGTVQDTAREMMQRQRPEGIAAAARGMAQRPDRTALLGSIAVPTLIITGAEDTSIPASESEAMHRAIPCSELLIIPEVGHLCNVQAPDAFNTAVSRFLAKVK